MPTNLMNTHEISRNGRRAPTPHPGPLPTRLRGRSTSARRVRWGEGEAAAGGRGFTLIEMLVVISVIAILASLIFPVTNAVHRNKVKSRTRAEMEQIITAIETYKMKKGHYPPDNPVNVYVHQLYYELAGTYLNNALYVTLDGKGQMDTNAFNPVFGARVGGFENCALNTNNQEEVSSVVKCFRGGLQPNQVDIYKAGNSQAQVLVGSIPLPRNLVNLSPPYPGVTAGGYCTWRYSSSSPTNNPNSFDLWIDIIVDGKTNRISNWKRDAEIVGSP